MRNRATIVMIGLCIGAAAFDAGCVAEEGLDPTARSGDDAGSRDPSSSTHLPSGGDATDAPPGTSNPPSNGDPTIDDDGDGGSDAGADPDGGKGSPDASSPGSRWMPKPGTTWQWQLTGKLDTSLDVAAYDIDLFDTPAQTITNLQASGKKVICYFSAGSWEDWRPDANKFPTSVRGKTLDGWPDEKWLDIRAQAVRTQMSARLDLAKSKGCDAVEPDNVDGYSNDNGFGLKGSDQLAFNRFLATEAHARNMSIALKNDLDQVSELVGDFDFALNEECFSYNECNMLKPFITANKAVLQVEYGGNSLVQSVCPKANALNFDTLIKNLDLDAKRTACR